MLGTMIFFPAVMFAAWFGGVSRGGLSVRRALQKHQYFKKPSDLYAVQQLGAIVRQVIEGMAA